MVLIGYVDSAVWTSDRNENIGYDMLVRAYWEMQKQVNIHMSDGSGFCNTIDLPFNNQYSKNQEKINDH